MTTNYYARIELEGTPTYLSDLFNIPYGLQP